MFNVHRRDIINFDNYMDLKKPGFGGPSSAKLFKDNSGKRVNKDPRLKEYQRVVERDPIFSHPVYNSTYKAMSHDVVYKQEKKKPYTYPDPYKVGIPIVDITEGKCVSSFERFINESSYGMNPMGEKRVPCRNEDKAEDILLDMRIDWDGWDEAPVGNGKSFTKDGDIVAYFDDSVRPHELVILPDAELMPEEEYNRVIGSENEEEEKEEEEEIEDTYFKPEKEDDTYFKPEKEFEAPKSAKSVRDIEQMLRDLEDEEDEEF